MSGPASPILPGATLGVMGGGQLGHGKQRRIGRTGVANRKGGHRNALGHLHDAVQRVHALQMLAGHRHAQHRHAGFGCQHARQMGCAASARNDGLQAAPGCGFGVGKQGVGHAVRRNHARFISHTKVLQDLHRVLHGRPVAVRAHHHAH